MAKKKPKRKQEGEQKLGPYQDAWVRTLESGNLKQARNALAKRIDGEWRYCCLGAACEMLRQNGVKGLRFSRRASIVNTGTYGEAASLMPGVAAVTLAMKSISGGVFTVGQLPKWAQREIAATQKKTACNWVRKGSILSLACLNDEFGFTFKQIARLIRENPELFFTHPA